jgi:hypothetical protein
VRVVLNFSANVDAALVASSVASMASFIVAGDSRPDPRRRTGDSLASRGWILVELIGIEPTTS